MWQTEINVYAQVYQYTGNFAPQIFIPRLMEYCVDAAMSHFKPIIFKLSLLNVLMPVELDLHSFSVECRLCELVL